MERERLFVDALKELCKNPVKEAGDSETEVGGFRLQLNPGSVGEATNGVGLSHSSEEVLVMIMERRA